MTITGETGNFVSNPKLDEYQVQSGRALKENGKIINIADRVDIVVRDFKVGTLVVNPLGVEVKVDADKLEGRHTVIVVNDSSALIFAGYDEVPNLALGKQITLFSGEAISFKFDPIIPRSLFVVTDEYTIPIRIFEIS